jgi:hypothetical protein
VAGLEGLARLLLDLQDLVADLDALVADADLAGAGDQVADLAPAFRAEGAEAVVGSPLLGLSHRGCVLTLGIISSRVGFRIWDF